MSKGTGKSRKGKGVDAITATLAIELRARIDAAWMGQGGCSMAECAENMSETEVLMVCHRLLDAHAPAMMSDLEELIAQSERKRRRIELVQHREDSVSGASSSTPGGDGHYHPPPSHGAGVGAAPHWAFLPHHWAGVIAQPPITPAASAPSSSASATTPGTKGAGTSWRGPGPHLG